MKSFIGAKDQGQADFGASSKVRHENRRGIESQGDGYYGPEADDSAT
jgi:hypothetical protein